MTSSAEKIELISFGTADELARTVAGKWLDEVELANRASKLYGVALSGGRITEKFFGVTVEQAKARKVFFEGVHFFWADERCVPPGDPESNFKRADELLFQPLKIPQNQIHRIRGEDSPNVAVKAAEAELRQVGLPNAKGQPVLDLIFLGMGEDGHVASLFPNAPPEIIHCRAPFVAIENSPKPPPRRISLSYPALAAARQTWVLVSGAGKEKALRESLGSGVKTPLGRVLQIRQKTLIFSQIALDKKI